MVIMTMVPDEADGGDEDDGEEEDAEQDRHKNVGEGRLVYQVSFRDFRDFFVKLCTQCLRSINYYYYFRD